MSLIKTFSEAKKPQRVVILGGGGFIGRNLAKKLEEADVPFCLLSKQECDLQDEKSVPMLSSFLNEEDVVVFLATVTPRKGKGMELFYPNVQMGENFAKVLEKKKLGHLIYLSSDTVYPLIEEKVHEATPLQPDNLFGLMHIVRENLFRFATTSPYAILRSTLIYGQGDPHNSYGPNRFRRMAQEGVITLFGKGEEMRDHISIEDVISLIQKVILHRCTGVLNLASGSSISYWDLAHEVASFFNAAVHPTERKNPITHRKFDVSCTHRVFPEFSFTPLKEGLRKVHAAEMSLATR